MRRLAQAQASQRVFSQLRAGLTRYHDDIATATLADMAILVYAGAAPPAVGHLATSGGGVVRASATRAGPRDHAPLVSPGSV